MAGAWEIQQPQVLVVILTREITSVAWAFGFRNLQIPGSYTGLAGMPFAEARDVGAQRALDLDYEFVFFQDDDVILQSDAILRLMSHKLPIVSGLYYRRNNPIVPVMLRETPENRQWITEFKVPDLIEVDYVGAGCLLIHCDVLRALPPIGPTNRWFEWRVNNYNLPERERMSEDFSFCSHARNHGYKIMVDTSIQAKHAGLSQAVAPGTLQPLELM